MRIGDEPIEARHREVMTAVAHYIDSSINPPGQKQNGFVLLVFPFRDSDGRCNYMSNADRDDVVRLLREQLARFEDDQ